MDYNFLLLEDDKLSIKNNGSFFLLNPENLVNLESEYTLISTYEIKSKNYLSSKILKLLRNNKVVINFEKVSSALKEVENNKIIAHLSRENFRKISFPIFVAGISIRIPNFFCPSGRNEIFASQRRLPSSILQSLTSVYSKIDFSSIK